MSQDLLKVYDELLVSVDIVDVISRYINVTKAGQNFKALCPFHDDRNPSLMISPSKKIFKCFVCNTGGNAISFVQLIEKTNYHTAAKKVAGYVNFRHPVFEAPVGTAKVDTNEPLFKAASDLALFYEASLKQAHARDARAYLNKRAISDELIKKYKIGYAPLNGEETISFLRKHGHSLKALDDLGIVAGDVDRSFDKNKGRIIFPLTNKDGKIVAFSAREFLGDDGPKYINSPESPIFIKGETLYNYDYVMTTQHAVKHVYLVEGFVDVIALNRAGILSSVALMGTAFSREHVNMLRKLNKEIRLFLDSDAAGQLATLGIMKLLDELDISYRLVRQSTAGDDPDDIITNHGIAALQKQSEDLIDKTEYLFNYYEKNVDLTTLAGRRKFADEMTSAIVTLKSRLEVDDYINKLSEKTNFSSTILLEMYQKKRQEQQTKRKVNETIAQKLPIRKQVDRLLLAERVVVLQMLNFPEAVTFFNEHVKVFSDEVYRYIANYLNEYEALESDVKFANLLSHINTSFSDETKKAQFSEEVLDLIEEETTEVFREDILFDALKQINYERELRLLNLQETNELKAVELREEEIGPIKLKYLKLKRELQQKYRTKK